MTHSPPSEPPGTKPVEAEDSTGGKGQLPSQPPSQPLPATPVLSSDGRFYWSGGQWIPLPSGPAQPQPSTAHAFITWLGPTGFVVLTTLILYLILHTAYGFFYRRFGVDPGEVGLGSPTDVLQRSSGWLVFLLALNIVGVPWLVLGRSRFERVRMVVFGVYVAVLATAIMGVLSWGAEGFATTVYEGMWIDSPNLMDAPLLDVRAHVVHLEWVKDKPGDWPQGDHCLLLGSSNSVLVIWDSDSKETLRVPNSLAIVRTLPGTIEGTC